LRAAHAIISVFALAALAPQILLFLLTPQGSGFIGYYTNPVDTLSYLMWIGQYERGSILAQNLYTEEQPRVGYFNPLFFAQSIATRVGMPYWLVEAISKIAFFAIYVLALERILTRYFDKGLAQKTLILVCAYTGIAENYFAANVMNIAFASSLSGFHLALQATIFLFCLGKLEWKGFWAICGLSLLLYLSHPYSIFYMAPALLAFIALRTGGERRLVFAATYALVLLAVGTMLYFQTGGSEIVRVWANMRFEAAGLAAFITTFAPLLVTSAYALLQSAGKINQADRKTFLPVLWILAVIAASLASGYVDWLPLQIPKLATGIVLPLVLVSFGNWRIKQLFEKGEAVLVCLFACLLVFALVAQVLYVPNIAYQKAGLFGAFENAKSDNIVRGIVSSPGHSVLAPYYTGKFSSPGHWGFVPDFKQRIEKAQEILSIKSRKELDGYCTANPSVAILADEDSGIYKKFSGQNGTPGFHDFGGFLLVKCHEIAN